MLFQPEDGRSTLKRPKDETRRPVRNPPNAGGRAEMPSGRSAMRNAAGLRNGCDLSTGEPVQDKSRPVPVFASNRSPSARIPTVPGVSVTGLVRERWAAIPPSGRPVLDEPKCRDAITGMLADKRQADVGREVEAVDLHARVEVAAWKLDVTQVAVERVQSISAPMRSPRIFSFPETFRRGWERNS